MTGSFSDADVELLQRHLQAIVEVEFFTIPLYLTAVYSFTEIALEAPSTLYTVQQEALSVAVQEMYHLQCACNILNAFTVTPTIPKLTIPAGTDLPIPHLVQNGRPLTTRLGALPAAIASMIDIESPDPDPVFPPPNNAVEYASISDLYAATLTLLGGYFAAFHLVPASLDPHFEPNNKQVDILGFHATYKYTAVSSRPDVASLMNAVTDQGEGRLVQPPGSGDGPPHLGDILGALFRVGDAGGVLPEFQPAAGSRFAAFGAMTHYQRFQDISAKIAGAPPGSFYPNGAPSPDLPPWVKDHGIDAGTLQSASDTIWSYVIDVLQSMVTNGTSPPHEVSPGDPSFAEAMYSFKYLIPMAWQFGVCPSFTYGPGVTAGDVQTAMDSVDPLSLFHWDAATAHLRAAPGFVANSCQGLNECAGKGWGTIGTTKGDGACATADLHTCGTNNSCRYQGGCGFLVSMEEGCGSGPPHAALLDPSEQWIPGQNMCKTVGGCQTPISPTQVFNRDAGPLIDSQTDPAWTPAAKQQLKAEMGRSVWDRARALFAEKEKIDQLPTPRTASAGGIIYDGGQRRAAIPPTSS